MPARQRWILFALIVVVLALNVIGTHNALTAPFPGHNDFLTPWEAARAYWLDGVPVYSEQSNVNIQVRIYGRPISEGEFPNYFAYPFYAVLLMWPYIHVPYDWAAALWMVTLEACLVTALVLLLDLYRWKPRPPMLAALVLWTLFWYPAVRGLLLGQVSHVVYLAQVAAIWAMVRQRDTTAGLALAASLFKPQMAFLLTPLLLLWALREQRWRVIGVFAAATAVLLALSFALQPAWVSDWLGELRRYTTYTAVGSPVWVVTQYYLGLGAVGEWVVSGALVALLLGTWLQALRQPGRWLWTAMLTLVVTHLVAPRTATTHFVVLAAPLLFYAAAWRHRRRGFYSALLLALTFIVPWLHFLTTVDGEFEHPATYLPLPVGVALLLWLTRRAWWHREGGTAGPLERSL